MEKFVVVCDNIRSLYNVGSIFRIADAMAVDKVFLCGITGTPNNILNQHKIAKVALGAEKTVPWEYCRQTGRIINKLHQSGYQVVSLELTNSSVDYWDFTPIFPIALVVGNEVVGLKKSVLCKSQQTVQIPMCGVKESLNVSVAFGIIASWINRFNIK